VPPHLIPSACARYPLQCRGSSVPSPATACRDDDTPRVNVVYGGSPLPCRPSNVQATLECPYRTVDLRSCGLRV
jgi:hypothetical protein